MMMIFLAAAVEDYPLPGVEPMGVGVKQHLILFGAIVLVVVAVLVGVILSRQKRRQSARREERRRRRHSFAKGAAQSMAEIKQYVEHRKERAKGRRRREHRPRNPTLAETGGLPPVRKDDPAPPTPPD